jgi:hypothetical protein
VNGEDYDSMLSSFQLELNNLDAAVENLNPNLKAIEQFEEITSKFTFSLCWSLIASRSF